MPLSNYSKIYAAIRRIPFGKVATYGQIAEVAGLPRQARLVGYALFQQEVDDDLPWHRVVNAQGAISYSPARQQADHLQRVLLEAEGVIFNARGRIDLKQFRWQPKRRHLKPTS
jgi:methylated-DNA-protein-cysteine methyltransferase-like protein